MESLEFNKIAAAVLVAVLITVGVSKLGGILYHADSPDEMSYIVETDEPSGTTVDDTAPAMSFDQLLAAALPEGGEADFAQVHVLPHLRAGRRGQAGAEPVEHRR